MTQSESNHLELPAAWKVILVTQMDYVSRCTSHWSQKEGSTLLKAVQIQQIKQVTKVPRSSRSMTVPSVTLPIQCLRLQNKLPVKHGLPPLQSQPTVINKLWWALRHVIHWKDPASFSTKWWSWYSLIWRTWGMDSGSNYSSFHLSLAMLYIFYTVYV